MGQTASSSLFSTATNDDALDALRAVDSAQLLAEVKRRNLDASDAREEKKSSHVVGSLRDKAADSDKREAELREALQKLGVDADSIEGGPPKRPSRRTSGRARRTTPSARRRRTPRTRSPFSKGTSWRGARRTCGIRTSRRRRAGRLV